MAQDPQGRVHPGQDAAEPGDSRRIVAEFVAHYNDFRLHRRSAMSRPTNSGRLRIITTNLVDPARGRSVVRA